jgi:acyl-coenzyme A synthetase/AMP-(fatty) acid ligase
MDLKNFLQGKLPEYFVPYKFIQKDVLPKTSSGKIDRMQLAALAKQ